MFIAEKRYRLPKAIISVQLLLSALLAAGCAAEPDGQTSGNVVEPELRSHTQPSAPALRDRDLIAGVWVVERTEPPMPSEDGWPIVVTVGPDRIDAISQCMPFHWLYGVVDGRLVLAPQPHGSPVCLRPFTFSEQAFQALMQSATAMTLAGDRLYVSGPHGRVVLRRYEAS